FSVPGVGLFGFGKNKQEARITTEFFINAIHVMVGANALEDGSVETPLPQARRPEQSAGFSHFHNYVALPRSEAFRIEYWDLEEAKLQRMPPEAEFSRKIGLIIGGANGIGREAALILARRGAHIVVADFPRNYRHKRSSSTAPGTIFSPRKPIRFSGIRIFPFPSCSPVPPMQLCRKKAAKPTTRAKPL